MGQPQSNSSLKLLTQFFVLRVTRQEKKGARGKTVCQSIPLFGDNQWHRSYKSFSCCSVIYVYSVASKLCSSPYGLCIGDNTILQLLY